MREELKGRNLSFTEIAKLVGENWQNLAASEKEPFESQAQAIKDKYLSDLTGYKKTPEYRKYMAYLHDFKVKHASPSQGAYPYASATFLSSTPPLSSRLCFDTLRGCADKDASKRVRLSEAGSQGRGSPGATPTRRTSRSGSGAESRRGSEPPVGRQRGGSTVSATESQSTASQTPSTQISSPDESTNPAVVVKIEGQQSSDRSPVFDTNPQGAPLFPGHRHANHGDGRGMEHPSNQRQLPSLFDVFDGHGLPGGIRPSHDPNAFRFPSTHAVGSQGRPLDHSGGDARAAPLKSEQHFGNSSAYPTYGHPRAPVDGPLPIHALLAHNKSDAAFDSRQQQQQQQHVSRPLHGTPYHADQKPRLVHQPPNGAGLPVINSAPPNRPSPSMLLTWVPKAITPGPPRTHNPM